MLLLPTGTLSCKPHVREPLGCPKPRRGEPFCPRGLVLVRSTEELHGVGHGPGTSMQQREGEWCFPNSVARAGPRGLWRWRG